MDWPLLILGVVALALFFARSQRTLGTEYIYHDSEDEDDYEASIPIQWGLSDYQSWPGDMLFDDTTNAEYKDEIVRLWNTAIDEGETEEAAELLEEYERLCRAGY